MSGNPDASLERTREATDAVLLSPDVLPCILDHVRGSRSVCRLLPLARTCETWRSIVTVIRLNHRGVVAFGSLREPQHAVEVGDALVLASHSDTPLVAWPLAGGPLRWEVRKGNGPGQLSQPNAVLHHEGVVYVTERVNDRVEAFDAATGQHLRTVQVRVHTAPHLGMRCAH